MEAAKRGSPRSSSSGACEYLVEAEIGIKSKGNHVTYFNHVTLTCVVILNQAGRSQ